MSVFDIDIGIQKGEFAREIIERRIALLLSPVIQPSFIIRRFSFSHSAAISRVAPEREISAILLNRDTESGVNDT
jgi:hypothetical protein